MSINGKKPVRDSKGNIVKNLYQKADDKPGKVKEFGKTAAAYKLARERKKTGRLNMDDLRRAINSVNGVSVTKNVTPAALKSVGKKINAAIPITKKKD
jgi:hypothetical protein